MVQFMWTVQGTVWYSLCGLDREQCGTFMWTGHGTHNIGTEEITGDDIYNLYSSPYDIMVLKWRCIRWAGHVAGIKEI